MNLVLLGSLCHCSGVPLISSHHVTKHFIIHSFLSLCFYNFCDCYLLVFIFCIACRLMRNDVQRKSKTCKFPLKIQYEMFHSKSGIFQFLEEPVTLVVLFEIKAIRGSQPFTDSSYLS